MMETKLLQEAPGVFSSTRAVFIGGTAWALAFTTAGTFYLSWTPAEAIAVFGATVGMFVGLKLGQKPLENKKAKQNGDQS